MEEKTKTRADFTKILPEGVNQDQISAWKAKYGDHMIKVIRLYKDGSIEPVDVVCRKPDRKITSEYMKWVDKNFEKATSILVTNCCLTRVDEIKADDELFFTAGTQLAELLPIGRGEIKNC